MKPDGKKGLPASTSGTKSRGPGERIAPKLETGDDGALNVTLEDDDQIRDLLGVETRAAAKGIMLSALGALGLNGDLYRDLMSAIAVELDGDQRTASASSFGLASRTDAGAV